MTSVVITSKTSWFVNQLERETTLSDLDGPYDPILTKVQKPTKQLKLQFSKVEFIPRVTTPRFSLAASQIAKAQGGKESGALWEIIRKDRNLLKYIDFCQLSLNIIEVY